MLVSVLAFLYKSSFWAWRSPNWDVAVVLAFTRIFSFICFLLPSWWIIGSKAKLSIKRRRNARGRRESREVILQADQRVTRRRANLPRNPSQKCQKRRCQSNPNLSQYTQNVKDDYYSHHIKSSIPPLFTDKIDSWPYYPFSPLWPNFPLSQFLAVSYQ